MTVMQWPIPDWLLNHPAVTNRNLLAQKWHRESTDAILQQYIKMDAKGAHAFYGQIFDCFPQVKLQGQGIELGAGVAAFSAVAASRYPAIEKIYALELVPDVVTLLQQNTVAAISADKASAVVPVIGSFDDIGLPDCSLDFCIEFASLHHSDNLTGTLKELSRVLKPGGVLIAVDRAHHNALTDEQIDFMLDLEYSAAWKKENGYDDAPLSRRTNGEHEIRLSSWEQAFRETGFDLLQRRELRTTGWAKWRRAFLLTLPFGIRKAMGWLPSRVRPQVGELSWYWRCNSGNCADPVYVASSHDYTLFLVVKK